MNRYVFPTTILTALLVLAPGAAFARSDKANPGGASASRVSAQGAANTNGPNAVDRQKGLARAQQRMSASGLEHQQATKHATGNKKKGADKDASKD